MSSCKESSHIATFFSFSIAQVTTMIKRYEMHIRPYVLQPLISQSVLHTSSAIASRNRRRRHQIPPNAAAAAAQTSWYKPVEILPKVYKLHLCMREV